MHRNKNVEGQGIVLVFSPSKGASRKCFEKWPLLAAAGMLSSMIWCAICHHASLSLRRPVLDMPSEWISDHSHVHLPTEANLFTCLAHHWTFLPKWFRVKKLRAGRT